MLLVVCSLRRRLEGRLSLAAATSPPSTPTAQASSQFSFFTSSSAQGSSQPSLNSNLDHSHQQSSAFASCNSSSTSAMQEGCIIDKHELIEVYMDMLATNAYSTATPLPLKPCAIDNLLNKDKSQMWLIGHKLVQITTTGCTSRAVRNGFCHKCYTICHMNDDDEDSLGTSSVPGSIQSLSSNQTLDRFGVQCTFDGNSPNAQQSTTVNNSRRRHRSDILGGCLKSNSVGLPADDFFANRTKVTPTISSSMSVSDQDSFDSSKYCRCWCQCWAEVIIRRATGNTRWVTRVENNLGDFPVWNFARQEDDSLANIFQHNDPEVCGTLKQKKKCMKSMLNEDFVASSEAIEARSIGFDEKLSRDGVSEPVTRPGVCRAASFNSSHRGFNDNPLTDSTHKGDQARKQVIYKMEKGQSFDEDNSYSDKNPTSCEQTKQQTIGGSSRQSLSNASSGSTLSSNGGNDNSTSSNNTNSSKSGTNGYRERGATISVMTPCVQKSASSNTVTGSGNSTGTTQLSSSQQTTPLIGNQFQGISPQTSLRDSTISLSTLNLSTRQPVSARGISPQFVFLQFFSNAIFKGSTEDSFDTPILLDVKSDHTVRSIKCFDCITPYETHKIGVIYVGPGQAKCRSAMLSNMVGSSRYTNFLLGLGQVIYLPNVDKKVCYVGGLDESVDGPLAISWGDHLNQVIFHVATFMPNTPSDAQCNKKMLHIGNDFVVIVYNNSGDMVDLDTIRVSTLKIFHVFR